MRLRRQSISGATGRTAGRGSAQGARALIKDGHNVDGRIFGLSRCGLGAWTVGRNVFVGKEPGIDDGQVRRDYGEEEKEDTYDFGDVEGVVGLENEGQNDQTDDGSADHDAGYGLRPRFLIAG